MMLKKLIAAVMAVTTMFSVMSVNAGAAQPKVDLSTSGAIYYDEDTTTDVEIISSRIIDMDGHNYNTIKLNVGAKVSLNNIFKLADGYDFDDFTYEITSSDGTEEKFLKLVKSSGKYYIKAIEETIGTYLRVYYKGKLIASTQIVVDSDYKSVSKITVSTKSPKIGQEITLKAITSNNKYARCSWIIVGDSSWDFPAAWYVDGNVDKAGIFSDPEIDKSSWGKATLSFNDFGKVKIYCLSPNGKLKKVEINISEEEYDDSVNYPDKTWFYDRVREEKVGYIKSDGSIVITNDYYENFASSKYLTFAYSWKKKCFYNIFNPGTADEDINWHTERDYRFVLKL